MSKTSRTVAENLSEYKFLNLLISKHSLTASPCFWRLMLLLLLVLVYFTEGCTLSLLIYSLPSLPFLVGLFPPQAQVCHCTHGILSIKAHQLVYKRCNDCLKIDIIKQGKMQYFLYIIIGTNMFKRMNTDVLYSSGYNSNVQHTTIIILNKFLSFMPMCSIESNKSDRMFLRGKRPELQCQRIKISATSSLS